MKRKQKRQAPTKQKQKQKQQLPLIPADSALAQLARRLRIIQGIPTNPPPDVLPLILDALLADDWRPPGYRVLSARAAMQAVRRVTVSAILDSAPPEYQRPRSTRTLDWVKEQLAEFLPSLHGTFADDTLEKDIDHWAYDPETGRRRKRQAKPPHNLKMGRRLTKQVKPAKPPRRKTKASANRPAR